MRYAVHTNRRGAVGQLQVLTWNRRQQPTAFPAVVPAEVEDNPHCLEEAGLNLQDFLTSRHMAVQVEDMLRNPHQLGMAADL
jgi:hypothetical protein